jgi:hemolysin III
VGASVVSADDLASAGVHIGGLLLAILLSVKLLRHAHTPGARIAVKAFCTAWVVLYAASVLYHLMPDGGWLKPTALALDNAAIFLAIAGSYTPVAVLTLRRPDAQLMLAAAWIPAAFALSAELIALSGGYAGWFHRNVFLLCIAQGWGPAVLHSRTLFYGLPRRFGSLVFASGVIYVAGVFLYRAHEMPWHHTYWHVAVVIGSLLNFAAIRVLLSRRALPVN